MTKGLMALAGAAMLVAGVALPIARADELSDMRANDVLLQQKIDQARALSGDVPEDGRVPLQGSFPGSFRVPGTQTSVRVGGNVTETVHDSLGR